LIQIGWLADHPEGVRIVNFEEHNGASAKKRSITSKRVANHRSGNADVTQPALQNDDTSVTGALAREEKIREETKDIPHTPQAGQRRTAIALQTYLDHCKQAGEKPIPADDAVFAYAKEAGISDEFLRLQWLEFKDRYSIDGAKRYKKWPTVFEKSVRGNWFRLWYAKDGAYELTTTGQQAKAVHRGSA